MVRDLAGKLRLWVAHLDRSAPPRQIPNVEGHSPKFGPAGEIFFRAVEGSTGFVYSVRPDGTQLRKAIPEPIIGLNAVSPDGNWLVTTSPIPGQPASATIAHPLRGGTPVFISNREPRPKWSRDGRFLYLSIATAGGTALANGNTYVFPLSPGRLFPDFPAGGLSEAEMAKWPGGYVIDIADFEPGPSPDAYAFSRETTQRNLYRIPIP